MPKSTNPREPVPPGSKFVRLQLTPEHQARLRVMAAERGMSMAAYARQIVIGVIEAEAAKGKTKK
jgi:hypothetical protein